MLIGGDGHQSVTSIHVKLQSWEVPQRQRVAPGKQRRAPPSASMDLYSCPTRTSDSSTSIYLTARPAANPGSRPPCSSCLPAEAPSSICQTLHYPPHGAVCFPPHPVESVFHTAAQGTSQALQSRHSPALSLQYRPGSHRGIQFFSWHCRVSLPLDLPSFIS